MQRIKSEPRNQANSEEIIPMYINRALRLQPLHLIGEFLSPQEAYQLCCAGKFFHNTCIFSGSLHAPDKKTLNALLTEVAKHTKVAKHTELTPLHLPQAYLPCLLLCISFFAISSPLIKNYHDYYTITVSSCLLAISSYFSYLLAISSYSKIITMLKRIDRKNFLDKHLAAINKLDLSFGYEGHPIEKKLQDLNIIISKSVIKELNLTRITPNQNHTQDLCRAITKSDQLTSLSLRHFYDFISKTQLTDLLTKNPEHQTAGLKYLQKLNIGFCNTVDDDIFDTLSGLILLDELAISRCPKIAGKGIEKILPRLIKLELDCYKEEQFNSGVQKTDELKLEALILTNCIPSEKSLQKLAPCLNKLSIRRKLDSDYKPSMIFGSPFNLAALKKLTTLEIEFCNFPEIVFLPKHLHALSWRSCIYQRVDLDKSPQFIEQLRTLRLLTVLNLSYAVMETQTLQSIIDNLPNIHTLTMDQLAPNGEPMPSKLYGDEAISVIASLKKITYLSISRWAITDIGLALLTLSCPQLAYLDLSDCRNLTITALNHCIFYLKKLHFLNCPNIANAQEETYGVLDSDNLIKKRLLISSFNKSRPPVATGKNGFFAQSEGAGPEKNPPKP